MTGFFTEADIPESGFRSSYSEKHLLIGSCFTEHIGARMENLKFLTDINPFGILFNPYSVSRCIRRLISGEPYTEKELFHYGDLWHSFMHHGKFSNPSLSVALSLINSRLASGSEFIRKTDFLILTFGTAWVFELKSSGFTVSNCHKVPSSEFKRYRLTVSEIVTEMRDTLEKLWDINPEVKVIFTVSPVRHLKDGASGNQLSKATLLLAADALVNGFGPQRCCYFPSYELVMDELRDYRFYAEDMVHPSPVAVGHIWEKFSKWFFDPETLKLSEKINSLVQARNHRPVHRGTREYAVFVANQLQKSEELYKTFPFLDFSGEIEYFAAEVKKCNKIGLIGSTPKNPTHELR